MKFKYKNGRSKHLCSDWNPAFCQHFAAFGKYCINSYYANNLPMPVSCCDSCHRIPQMNTNPVSRITTTTATNQPCCRSNPCKNGGTFTSDNYNCYCKCPINYFGFTCEFFSCCSSNPCLNGGLCINNDINGKLLMS